MVLKFKGYSHQQHIIQTAITATVTSYIPRFTTWGWVVSKYYKAEYTAMCYTLHIVPGFKIG